MLFTGRNLENVVNLLDFFLAVDNREHRKLIVGPVDVKMY